jgi:diguanylate cyclase (GGDEF)-like protein/PAS domain S-box-containing protein
MEYSADFFKQLLDSMYDGVYFVDTERSITYWNKAARRITGYSAEEVLGHCCADNLLMHVTDDGTRLCTSGCPLTETIKHGTERSAEVFVHHKDGHRVPIRVRVAPIRNAAGRITGAVETFTDNWQRVEQENRILDLEKRALTDPLTATANRGYTEDLLTSRFEDFLRNGWPCGVLMIDIDHFKLVNDTHGHDAGDTVLRMVAKTLSNCLRGDDLVGRWGGEEFLVLLPGTTESGMRSVAERCRRLVAESEFLLDGQPVRVTISVGGARTTPGDKVETLVKRADMMLYACKEGGRNQVRIASGSAGVA